MTAEKIKQASQFLGVTVILVTVIGFASWLSLTNPLQSNPSLVAPASQTEKVSRLPASLPAEAAVQEIHCRRPPQKLKLAGAHVRLRLVACPGMEKSEVSVRNATNGFTASVFKTAKDVTTDYIDLVDGPNSLLIEIREDKSATREIEIEVVRAPPGAEVATNR